MSKKEAGTILHYLQELTAPGESRDLTDRQLLEHFISKDQAAFSSLIKRHGRLVWSVCRRTLGSEQDAEDAFQAVFVVLACKAGSIRRAESLSSWLHEVALRTAMNAKRKKTRQEIHERRHAQSQSRAIQTDINWQQVQAFLDEEIQRLPPSYRAVFLLCCMEGKSVADAARELDKTKDATAMALSRARKRLQERLSERGVALGSVFAAAALTGTQATAAIPPGLVSSTIRAAASVTAHQTVTSGALPRSVATMVKLMLKEMAHMSMAKLGLVAATLVLASGLAAGVSGFALFAVADKPSESAPPATAAATRVASPVPMAKNQESYGGTVRDTMSGKPVAGVKVVVRRFVNGKPEGKAEFASDTQGRFRINLPAVWVSTSEAQLAVDVEAPRGYVAFPYRDEMGAGTEFGVPIGDLRWEQGLGMPPYFDRMLLFPTKELRGRLELPNGRPAEGVDVVACSMARDDKAFHHVVRRTKTDREGRFTVEAASPGRAVLYFLPQHDAARYVKLNNAQGDLGSYKLEKGVEVTGKLMDVRNRPLPGCWVRIGTSAGPDFKDTDLDQVGLGGFARWSKTGPDGMFRAAPLPAGEYEASAHGINRRPGIEKSFHGGNPSWDELAGRERTGNPLEACIVPQKIVVRPGHTPPVILRAVPHVNIKIRATDGEGGKPKANIHVSYRFEFDGKEFFTYSGFVEMPTAREGRLTIRVPRGTTRFDAFLVAKGFVCRVRNKDDQPNPLGQNYVTLLDLDADKTVECVCRPCINVCLKLSSKDGVALKQVEIDARQSWREPCYVERVGDGIYWISFIQPERRLTITVKAKGCETVRKEVSIAKKSLGRIDLVLEKKK